MRHAPLQTAVLASAGALLLAACSSMPANAPADGAPIGASTAAAAGVADPSPVGTSARATASTVRQASVKLAPASGSLVSGQLLLRPMGDGVHLTGEVGGLLRNGVHAIHIHATGDCSAADASSAGGHFNPTGDRHGKVGSASHHGGDMDNIVANASGVATVSVHARGVVLGGGARSDVLGRAVVVHAQGDDYTSQPAGNAGARVACGVISAGG